MRIDLPPEIAHKLNGQENREVVMGLRAEDVVESISPKPGAMLSGRVSSVLPVGSDQFLDMDMDGARLFLRLGKECRYREGETASLAINLNRIHLFDKASTESILWR
jgi:multiple sugar transport system ATP-binding protein